MFTNQWETRCAGNRYLVLIFSALIANIVIYFSFFLSSIIRVPYWDQILWIREFLNSDTDYLKYLWNPHNEHRIVFSRLLHSVDLIVTRGALISVAVVIQVIWVCLVILAVWAVTKTIQTRALSFIVGSILLIFTFSTLNFVFTSYPINAQFVFAFGFFFLALSMLFTKKYWYLTPAFAFCAHVSSANGLFTWPIVVIVALFRYGSNKRSLIMIAAAAFFVPLYYVGGYTGSDKSVFLPIHSILPILKYFFETQGLPWSIMPNLQTFGLAAGIFLTFLEVGIILLCVRKRPQSTHQWVAAGCVAFCLLSCAALAPFRYSVGARVGGRYAIFSVVGYVSILAYSTSILEKKIWADLFLRNMTLIAATLLCVGQIPIQFMGGKYYKSRAEDFHDRARAIIRGEKDTTVTNAIYTDSDSLPYIFEEFKARRIYMYRD